MAENAFAELMQRVCAGSDEAARELVDRYGQHILRVVRRGLNRQLRAKFDSVDFVQAVWMSFFEDRSQLEGFEQPEQLAAYLGTLARNKVVQEFRRRLQTHKYNVSREHPLDEPRGAEVPPGKQPTPSQVAIVKESWDRMMEGQPSHYREIIRLRSEGATFREIAEIVQVNEKTCRRLIERLQREQG